jgi:site-specific DNA-methyltransferase (adenine-specific)
MKLELLKTSFAGVSTGRTRMIDIWWNGFGTINSGETRIHPCQKPVRLYNWILENYAEKGMKILDTHLGSGNIAVACHYFGVDLVGCEIDTEYYNGALKNYKDNTAQTLLTF